MQEVTAWEMVLGNLQSGINLSEAESAWVMDEIISGAGSDEQITALLLALRAKGETVEEMMGFRDAVLRNAVPLMIDRPALDIVGTGGDQLKTVNVSSTAAIICAAAGVPVMKHGNRAASSASGSSDVYRELGVNLSLSPAQVMSIFDDINIGFAFAALHHPGFKHVAHIRSELGVPTVFNILGPLCNPARPIASCIGVADEKRVPLVVGTVQHSGMSALVIRGDDGMDELSTTGKSHLWQVHGGAVTQSVFDPREVGLPIAQLSDLIGGTPAENAETIRRVLAGEPGPVRDIVLLNAAAGLAAFELATQPTDTESLIYERIARHLDRAREAVDSGLARNKLLEWIDATQRFAS